jgi:hypothetical protein
LPRQSTRVYTLFRIDDRPISDDLYEFCAFMTVRDASPGAQLHASPQHWSEAVSRRRQRIHRRFPGISARPTGLLCIPDAQFIHRFALWLGVAAGSFRRLAHVNIKPIRKEHWDGARENARYPAKLKANPSLGFHYPGSVEYEGGEQLIRLGLLREDQVWMRIRNAGTDMVDIKNRAMSPAAGSV